MDKPVGKNNGIVRGKKYFEAEEKCGLLWDHRLMGWHLVERMPTRISKVEGILKRKTILTDATKLSQGHKQKISPKIKQKNNGSDARRRKWQIAIDAEIHEENIFTIQSANALRGGETRSARTPLQKTRQNGHKDYVEVKEANAKLLAEKKTCEERIKELYSTIAKLEEKIKTEQKDLAAEHENEDKVRSELATVHNSLKELQFKNEELRRNYESKQADLNETKNALNATIFPTTTKTTSLGKDGWPKYENRRSKKWIGFANECSPKNTSQTKQRNAQQMKKLQSAVDAKENEIAETKRSLEKATKVSKELSSTDQQIEAMQTKVSKSNALIETMKRQKEDLNLKFERNRR